MLETGHNILLVHRRLFEGDPSRFFLGKVFMYEAGLVKVHGFSWTRDTFNGNMIKKNEMRTKIFSLMSGTVLTYQLPEKVDVENAEIVYEGNGQIVLKDASGFRMDLSEAQLKK